MGFKKSREELPVLWRDYSDPAFYNAEVISVLYETKYETLKRIIPPPFEMYDKPYILFNYNMFPATNFGVPYIEPSLMLPLKYKGTPGMYTLGMLLNDDIGIYCGRMLGYPKKYAQVEYGWDGDRFKGSVDRHGIKLAKMDVDFGVEVDSAEAEKVFAELFAPAGDGFPGHEKHGINWLHYNPLDAQGTRWDDMMASEAPNVQIVAGWKTAEGVEPVKYGKGSIEYQWSDDDPWAELEVVRIVGARRTVSNVKLLQGEVVDEIPAKEYAPYAYLGWDAFNPEIMK